MMKISFIDEETGDVSLQLDFASHGGIRFTLYPSDTPPLLNNVELSLVQAEYLSTVLERHLEVFDTFGEYDDYEEDC